MANNPFSSLLGGVADGFGESIQNQKLDQISSKIQSARVVDTNLNTDSTMWSNVGEWAGLGTIKFALMSTPTTTSNAERDNTTNLAKPLFPNIKNYPLVNEIVLIFQLPNTNESQTSTKGSYYYINPISLWNSPHHNAYPDMYSKDNGQSAPSFLKDYANILIGNFRRPTDKVEKIDLNGSSGGTFVEESNIHPVLPFAGDNILEGRFGNSFRLGNTSKSQGKIKNNWSNSGKNGSPISILRNGQSPSASSEGWVPVTENINEDLASVYLTSTQQIPIEVATGKNVSVFGFLQAGTVPFSNTIKKTPISPKSYNAPQVILNSGRLLFNTTTDSILMSAQKSIVLESLQDLAIKSDLKNVNVIAPNGVVSLGKQNATESVVLGDKFLLQFENLVQSLENLCVALSNEPLIPGASSVATLTKPVLENIRNLVPSMKSQKVKVS